MPLALIHTRAPDGMSAPEVVVEGAVNAAKSDPEIEVVLFGPDEQIRRLLPADSPESVSIVDAPDVIGMAESPSAALRKKTESSIHRALGAHKAGKADAFVSAGNTGAVMAVSLVVLGRLGSISRPSVIGLFPSIKGQVVVVDVGTNVDCKPEHLVHFAVMGSIYAERILGCDSPRVGLLNVGEERGKGNELTKAAFDLLEQTPAVNFAGNIEGRDILAHAADVVVCDGFVGNVILKLGESVASVLPKLVGAEMQHLGLPAEQQQIVAKTLSGVRKKFDYEEFGGAPLLGVDGNVIIGHGGSTVRAIENMVRSGAQLVRQGVRDALEKAA